MLTCSEIQTPWRSPSKPCLLYPAVFAWAQRSSPSSDGNLPLKWVRLRILHDGRGASAIAAPPAPPKLSSFASRFSPFLWCPRTMHLDTRSDVLLKTVIPSPAFRTFFRCQLLRATSSDPQVKGPDSSLHVSFETPGFGHLSSSQNWTLSALRAAPEVASGGPASRLSAWYGWAPADYLPSLLFLPSGLWNPCGPGLRLRFASLGHNNLLDVKSC